MRNIESSPIEEPSEIKFLHRGVWADELKNGQELPVGGKAIWSKEMDLKLRLDFESFSGELERFNEDTLKQRFEEKKEPLLAWLKQVGTDVDPYLFFVANHVQTTVTKLLEVSNGDSDGGFKRAQKFSEGNTPALSELKGETMCAERAALGQYLLQKAGIESTYVSGVSMSDAKDSDEFPEDHSFIVTKIPDGSGTYIFDIARPKSQHNLPRILKTAVPFTYDLMAGKKELLVKAKEVLPGGEIWFGVGDPVCGEHDLVE